MTNNAKEKLEKAMKDFIDWLGEHETLNLNYPAEVDVGDKIKQCPAVLDILIKKDEAYFDALEKLEEKHRSLTTLEDIDKLTNDILKICK